MTELLDRLRVNGAHEQLATVLARDPAARVRLDDPHGVAGLLERLPAVGAHEQVTAFADRLPAAECFDQFGDIGDHRERFRFGREPDGSPAARWTWDDLE